MAAGTTVPIAGCVPGTPQPPAGTPGESTSVGASIPEASETAPNLRSTATATRLESTATAIDTAGTDTRLPFFDLVNAERRAAGLEPYVWHPILALTAQSHALDLATGDAQVHLGSDGRDAVQRMRDAGYAQDVDDWQVGENVAAGESPNAALERLMDDAPHRNNILHPRYVHAGVGVAATEWGGHYYVLDLGLGDPYEGD